MSIRNHPRIVQLTIEKFSKKGNGIGTYERQDGTNWPAEVSFTIPGDQARVQLLRKRAGQYQSRLEEIVSPSKERIEPRCKHFGLCGGCRWQQMPYDLQLQIKQQIVLKHFSGLIDLETDVRSILPSVNLWHYRNKMEFTFSTDKAKNNYLGLIMDSGKGRVFHLTECHLPNTWFVEALNATREWWKESGLDAYHARGNHGSLRTLTLREGQRTGDRMVNLTVSGNPSFALKKHQLESFVSTIRKSVEPIDPDMRLSIFLTIHQAIKGQPTRFFEMHLYGQDHIREILNIKTDPAKAPKPITFKISSSAFFQPNTAQAEVLYNTMLNLAQISKSGVIYDLYCGTGTLGIIAAARAKEVVGIELSPEASLDAKANAHENGMHNVSILTGTVHEKLADIRRENLFPLPDYVLVDPPRAGLESEAINHLTAMSPKKIIYISCNPATQAKNILEICEAGYRLTTLQPVDQFPHTIHIENIAILSKI